MTSSSDATLGWRAEATMFFVALVLVTVVYLPVFFGQGNQRIQQLAAILGKNPAAVQSVADVRCTPNETKARLDPDFCSALFLDVQQKQPSTEPLVLGQWVIATPSVAESEFRKYRKAIQDRNKTFWDPKRPFLASSEDSVARLMSDLDPSVASKFFGWEQWTSYVLAAWSLLLLWSQWRVVTKAENAWLKMGPKAIQLDWSALADVIDGNLGMLRFSIWAIPTIGFIGTVRGMGSALAAASSPENTPLIVGHLGVAFDTTLVGLLLSLVLVFFKHRFDTVVERLPAR